MDLSVDEHGEKLIMKLVAEGRYASATDVVEEGLRLLKKRDAGIGAAHRKVIEITVDGVDIPDEHLIAREPFTQK